MLVAKNQVFRCLCLFFSDASILNAKQQQQQQQQEAIVTPAAAIIKRPLKVTSQSETPYQIEHSKKLKRAEETLPAEIRISAFLAKKASRVQASGNLHFRFRCDKM